MPNVSTPVNAAALPLNELLSLTRRNVAAALAACAVASPALASSEGRADPGLPETSPTRRARSIAHHAADAQFLAWEREWSRYEALLTAKGAWPEERQHEFDDRLDEQSLIERLILETPSTTLMSARTKARLLLHYARQNFEPDGAALAMQHILRAVENVL